MKSSVHSAMGRAPHHLLVMSQISVKSKGRSEIGSSNTVGRWRHSQPCGMGIKRKKTGDSFVEFIGALNLKRYSCLRFGVTNIITTFFKSPSNKMRFHVELRGRVCREDSCLRMRTPTSTWPFRAAWCKAVRPPRSETLTLLSRGMITSAHLTALLAAATWRGVCQFLSLALTSAECLINTCTASYNKSRVCRGHWQIINIYWMEDASPDPGTTEREDFLPSQAGDKQANMW